MRTTEAKSTSIPALPSKSNTASFFQTQEGREPLFGATQGSDPFFKAAFPAGNSLKPAAIQAKLTVGAPDDAYEQEADAMADHVVGQGNMPIAPLESKNNNYIRHAASSDNSIQRQVFGEQIWMNSLDGQPPRAEVYGPATDAAIALELYGDASVPIVFDPGSAMTIFVDYSRLREDYQYLFEPSNLNTTDFLLTSIGSIGSGRGRAVVQQRRQAALALADMARAEITNTALIDAYLQRTDLTNEEKAATMGQLIVLHGKVEFLLGWIYEGGVQDPDHRGFENSGDNTGDFPNRYQEQGGGLAVGGNNRWCTSFAGYLYNTLGLVPDNVISSHVFLSGYRLRHWATTGQDNDDNQVTPAAGTLESRAGEADSGAAMIDRDVWRDLRTSLRAAHRADRPGLVDTFFETHEAPQPGDIFLIGGANNNFQDGHSHTVIVENYDPVTYAVTTIEGNASNEGISSQVFYLNNTDTLGKIILLARPGTQFANTPTGAPAIEVDDFELLQPIASVITRLVAFASAPGRGWICSDNPNASVQDWLHGPLCEES